MPSVVHAVGNQIRSDRFDGLMVMTIDNSVECAGDIR